MPYHVLLVDPHQDHLAQLDRAFRYAADVNPVDDFREARRALLENPPDLVVTNLRLGPYNGIHLALLASMSHTRCLVYAKQLDLVLARQVQAAGAFYVPLEQLPFVLPAFLILRMPLRDRRDPAVLDRRKTFRGGRRMTDVRILNAEVRGRALGKFKR
jgi:DNA-binding NtrC family response regulator